MKARLPATIQKPAKKRNTANCDNGCGKEFAINIQVEKLGEIANFGACNRKYMVCPHCGEQYNIAFANAEVDELIQMNIQLTQIHNKESKKNQKRNKTRGLKLMHKIEAAWRQQIFVYEEFQNADD